jgi:hypothetical protein
MRRVRRTRGKIYRVRVGLTQPLMIVATEEWIGCPQRQPRFPTSFPLCMVTFESNTWFLSLIYTGTARLSTERVLDSLAISRRHERYVDVVTATQAQAPFRGE